ncbi:MAG: hypothetical protein ICV73_09205, partial [Acetobacteraceae bacterium]|nr:hypothetical protein [Acetobacteraceae bacterium]
TILAGKSGESGVSEAAPAAKLGLPELPKLDPQDLEAIRRFLPGKLLGRLAALLGVLLLVLGFAGAVDIGFRQFFGVNLSDTPWLRALILFELPFAIVLAQVVVERRAAWVTMTQRLLAVAPAAVPAGYFRIGPYTDAEAEAEADRKASARRSGARDRPALAARDARRAALPDGPIGLRQVFPAASVRRAVDKSSLLQAFVVPSTCRRWPARRR